MKKNILPLLVLLLAVSCLRGRKNAAADTVLAWCDAMSLADTATAKKLSADSADRYIPEAVKLFETQALYENSPVPIESQEKGKTASVTVRGLVPGERIIFFLVKSGKGWKVTVNKDLLSQLRISNTPGDSISRGTKAIINMEMDSVSSEMNTEMDSAFFER